MFVAEKPTREVEDLERFELSSNDRRLLRNQENYEFIGSFITDCIKCPGNKGNERYRYREEKKNCPQEWLMQEIRIIDPLLVVAFGWQAWRILNNLKIEEKIDAPIVFAYHYSIQGITENKFEEQFARLK